MFILQFCTVEYIKKAITRICENCSQWKPQNVFTDDDESQISALRDTLPNTNVFLCYTHLSRTWRRALRNKCENKDEFEKLIVVLENMKWADSQETFDVLQNQIIDCKNNNVSEYYNVYYRPRVQMWAYHRRCDFFKRNVNTTNAVESWNQYVCLHFTLFVVF